ncbi:MAG: HAD family hydrolase [Candidatus Binatia bacterium]
MTDKQRQYGVIFDLDGVLIDSEGLYYRAYSEVLKSYGVTVSRDEYERYWIAQGNGPEYIVEKHQLPLSADELRQQRSPIYLQLLEREVKLMPYVPETLAQLAPHFMLTVATNSNREHLDAVLQRMEIAQFFPMTVARQDYRQPKPQPDAFLTAADKLGLSPTQCIVVEDTYKGITAADRAGIRCVAVPNEYTLHNDFSRASLILPNLAALTVEVVRGLLE